MLDDTFGMDCMKLCDTYSTSMDLLAHYRYGGNNTIAWQSINNRTQTQHNSNWSKYLLDYEEKTKITMLPITPHNLSYSRFLQP